MAESARTRLQSIDVLRGLAVLAVLLLHVPHRSASWGNPPDLRYWLLLPFDYGGLGVLLFLLLSGFCIHSHLLRRATSQAPLACDWKSFWRRRFTRLYPPYLTVVVLCTALILGLLAWQRAETLNLTRHYNNGERSLMADVVTHLLLVHNLTADYATGLGDPPLWSLGMEEQLYLLYFAYLFLRRRLAWQRAVTVVFLAAVPAWAVWSHLAPESIRIGPVQWGSWGNWPIPFWFAWVVGSLAAEASAGRITLADRWYRPWNAVSMAGLGLTTHPLAWTPLTGTTSFGVCIGNLLGVPDVIVAWLDCVPALSLTGAMFVLVNICVRAEARSAVYNHALLRALAFVGVFSYSLYLTHVPVLWFCVKTLHLSNTLVAYAICVPVCLVAGWLFFHFVERRFLFAGPARTATPTAGGDRTGLRRPEPAGKPAPMMESSPRGF